jgi:hypothetical protein
MTRRSRHCEPRGELLVNQGRTLGTDVRTIVCLFREFDVMAVRSLNEAKEWFDKNNDGVVECIRDDGATINASTFHEAHIFYEPPQLSAAIEEPKAIGEQVDVQMEGDESASDSALAPVASTDLQPA